MGAQLPSFALCLWLIVHVHIHTYIYEVIVDFNLFYSVWFFFLSSLFSSFLHCGALCTWLFVYILSSGNTPICCKMFLDVRVHVLYTYMGRVWDRGFHCSALCTWLFMCMYMYKCGLGRSAEWVLAVHVHVSMGLVPETVCGVWLCCLPGMRCCVTQYARAGGAYGQVWLWLGTEALSGVE